LLYGEVNKPGAIVPADFISGDNGCQHAANRVDESYRFPTVGGQSTERNPCRFAGCASPFLLPAESLILAPPSL